VTSSGEKRPHFFHPPPDSPCLLLAGLWEKWQRKTGFILIISQLWNLDVPHHSENSSSEYETLYTVSIVTRDAICGFNKVHDRMPAILPTMSQVYEWINPHVILKILLMSSFPIFDA
jgi:putative SOS response-associated peptidase YedK